ncbi:hypothetical protein Tco_1487569, partial [Tanacetum coccineum]
MGSSILADTSSWMNDDPFLLSSKLSRIYLILRYRLEHELGLRELVASLSGKCLPPWNVLMALIEVEGCDEHWGSIV